MRGFAPPRSIASSSRRGGRSEGEVLDARGDPVVGARVAVGLVPTYLAVGTTPAGVAVTDARGRFRLADLADGTVTLEAFAPDLGRAHQDIRVLAGETTRDVRFVLRADLAPGDRASHEPAAAGSVAVTLGETTDPREVVVVAVADGSEAERAGLVPGDTILAVEGTTVATMEEARAKLSGPLGDDVLLTVRHGDRRRVAPRVARTGTPLTAQCSRVNVIVFPSTTLQRIVLSSRNVNVWASVGPSLSVTIVTWVLSSLTTLYVPVCLSRGVVTVIASPRTSISVSLANEFAADCASAPTPSALRPFHFPSSRADPERHAQKPTTRRASAVARSMRRIIRGTRAA